MYWFCHISTWICHRYTRVPHPELSSLPVPPLWVVPVHQPQAASIVHRTWTGDSFHIWYWRLITLQYCIGFKLRDTISQTNTWNGIPLLPWSYYTVCFSHGYIIPAELTCKISGSLICQVQFVIGTYLVLLLPRGPSQEKAWIFIKVPHCLLPWGGCDLQSWKKDPCSPHKWGFCILILSGESQKGGEWELKKNKKKPHTHTEKKKNPQKQKQRGKRRDSVCVFLLLAGESDDKTINITI